VRTNVQALSRQTRDFITTEVLPIDDAFDGNISAAGGDQLRIKLQTGARAAGVFAPHAPVEHGGLGLGMVDRAGIFEEAGFSLFGPTALNIAAPDEGNVHLLAHVASSEQKDRFLAPLARGEQRSAFAMTEPAPGAGSDPAALMTKAIKVGGGWLVNGRKWFITGADGASFFIIMARTSGDPGGRGGATMLLADATSEGLAVGRHLNTMDKSMLGGHCEVTFTDLFVPDNCVLGGVDEGFRYAQVRLGPARMTHVMRWLGSARRAHEVAVTHVTSREAFGSHLSDLGMIQQLIADKACAELDSGSRASKATSIAKTFAAEALDRVADRATQMCGGLGVADDLPVAKIARELRPFRIYDGPSEVHRWSIAKRAVHTITGGVR
jgi:alkylation response protein AidB-like acyl-CoA dehydrogenase